MSTQLLASDVERRTAELLAEHQYGIRRRVDRLMAGLLVFEWLAAILIANAYTALNFAGARSVIHPHVWIALYLGAMIISLPVWLTFTRPTSTITRHATAAGQLLMSGLLIHVGGGRIEMHFHVFGSLAFLAFYRDWRVLITGSAIISVDHLVRGIVAPQSVYGVTNATIWRTLEHAGWIIFEDIFLISSCIQATREMAGIARTRALLEQSHHEVELKVQERTQQLEQAHQELVNAARAAGMAEIATSVLHNVGNVLNSVNVSATVVADRLKRSEVPTLQQVSDLVAEHQSDLGAFFANDARGQALPGFIAELSTCLNSEHDEVVNEVAQMAVGIDHIKQIVAAQQSMARRTSCATTIAPRKLLDIAIAMQSPARAARVAIERTVGADVPDRVLLDEHKVLQILINLLSNARHAVLDRRGGEQRVQMSMTTFDDPTAANPHRIRFAVSDSGVGIAPENLDRIFRHGFTTKKEGHGFGLHSAANAAREMGGSLTVASEGIGRGATFTLDLPLSADDVSNDAEPCTTPVPTDEREPIACH